MAKYQSYRIDARNAPERYPIAGNDLSDALIMVFCCFPSSICLFCLLTSRYLRYGNTLETNRRPARMKIMFPISVFYHLLS